MLKVAFYTLGCKVNQYETEGVVELFKGKGYNIVSFEEFADIYIINTCTVTNLSDKKSRQMINRAKQINSDAYVVAMGCYAQVSPEEVSKIEGVNLILGTKNRNQIIDLIEENLESHEKMTLVDDIMKTREFEELSVSTYTERTRAFIKIQEGCTQFCSYCIIPYARGPVRSRKPEDVITEVIRLSQNGFKEVVITGIHIASYGRDFKDKTKLIDILEKINNIEGILRIRLGSLEPTIIDDEFLKRLSNLTKICPHFHLSLQSGSNDTLKRMNRKYSSEQYKVSIDLIRKYYSYVAITTDIIVGFPGETEEEFNQSINFAKQINFSKIHVFKYSPRKGTPAATYPDQISNNIKEERSKKLIELSSKCEKEFSISHIGQIVEVLFEHQPAEKINYQEGHTPNYLKVVVEFCGNLEGQIRMVRVIGFEEEHLEGVLV